MVALATPACPSSVQLRWGFRCRRSPDVPFRVRFGSFDRRRRVGTMRAEAGGGEEKPSRLQDPFAGWFGEVPKGGASEGKKNFEGIVGVVLAGFFLAAGVTFAALSFGSKRPTGLKPQMEPLTSQQEVLLSSEDENKKPDIVQESVMALPNDDINDPESNANEYCTTPQPIADSSSRSRSYVDAPQPHFSIQQTGIASAAANTVSPEELHNVVESLQLPSTSESPNPSVEDNMQTDESASGSRLNVNFSELITSGVNSETADEAVNTSSTEDLENNQDSNQSSSAIPVYGFTNVSHQDDLHRDLESDNTDFTVQTHNAADVHPADPASCAGDELEIGDAVQQEENSVQSETEKPESLGEASVPVLSETLVASSHTELESNTPLDAKAASDDLSEMVDYFSSEPNTDRDEKVQHKSETSTMLQLGQVINESISVSDVVMRETVSSTLDQGLVNGNGNFGEPNVTPQTPPNNSQTPTESFLRNESFLNIGIPAPSVASSMLQLPLGKVLVPAVVDQVQSQAFTALQALKVIENDVQPGDICSRREYARWLVSASSTLSRNTTSKVYPAMYIENVTELAFDDITPEDPDFSCIQGLAEAGLISSKLSRADMNDAKEEKVGKMLFVPESPLSRQDLVSWKMALEKRQLSEVDRKIFHQSTGYIDMNRINKDAWPAILADLSSGENSIISLAFGYTRLFQPEKPVTKAQAAVALSAGDAAEVVGEELARIEAESLAETAVEAHTALVAEVEKDLNASFVKELALEREKLAAIERLAEEARAELDKLRTERDEENNLLIKGRVAVESEMEILSRLRNEVEEQLQSLISNKTEIAFERDHIKKLRMAAETENHAIIQLQNELDVERKALAMARAWAEDEAMRAREQAKALEEARERWERHGIKVIVDEELRQTASDGVSFHTQRQVPVEEKAGSTETFAQRLRLRSKSLIEEMKVRAESLVEKLKVMAVEVRGKSAAVIKIIIEKIETIISALKQQASAASKEFVVHRDTVVTKTKKSMQDFKNGASEFGSGVRDGAKRTIEDCKESMEKFTQKFKT